MGEGGEWEIEGDGEGVVAEEGAGVESVGVGGEGGHPERAGVGKVESVRCRQVRKWGRLAKRSGRVGKQGRAS